MGNAGGLQVREVNARFIGRMRWHINVARPNGGATLVRTPREAVDLIVADNVEVGKRTGQKVVARITWLNCPRGFRAPDPHKLDGRPTPPTIALGR
jgi:hypothetical protein